MFFKQKYNINKKNIKFKNQRFGYWYKLKKYK